MRNRFFTVVVSCLVSLVIIGVVAFRIVPALSTGVAANGVQENNLANDLASDFVPLKDIDIPGKTVAPVTLSSQQAKRAAEPQVAEVNVNDTYVDPSYVGASADELPSEQEPGDELPSEEEPGDEGPPSGYRPPANARSGQLLSVTEREFNLHKPGGLVLVRFGAEWCSPCRQVVPELQQVAFDNAGTLTVLSVDIDAEERLAEKYGVGPIPHIMLFRNGKKIEEWTGFRPASEFQRAVNEAKPPAPIGQVQANPFA